MKFDLTQVIASIEHRILLALQKKEIRRDRGKNSSQNNCNKNQKGKQAQDAGQAASLSTPPLPSHLLLGDRLTSGQAGEVGWDQHPSSQSSRTCICPRRESNVGRNGLCWAIPCAHRLYLGKLLLAWGCLRSMHAV